VAVARTGTDTLCVVALPEETVDTTDWECETGLGRTAVMMSECAEASEGRVVLDGKSASKGGGSHGDGLQSVKTYLCALDLAPLALPPDLPPVILMDLGGGIGLGELVVVVSELDAVDGCALMDGCWCLEEEEKVLVDGGKGNK